MSMFSDFDFGGTVGVTVSRVAMMTQPAQPPGVEESISVVTSGRGGGAGAVGGGSQSISITPVRQQLSQNGTVVTGVNVVELPLDSPEDGSNNEGGAQVTAQVVVSSGPNSADQNAGGNSNHATLVGSTHYITVAVSEGDAVGSDTVAQGVHSSYVQYVEGATEQAIYQATNGQMAYPVYTVGGETGSMYTPATGQYYTPGNQTAVTYTQVSPNQAAANQLQAASQLLAAQGNASAYLIQQGVDHDAGHTHTLISTQRSSPSAVTAEGGPVSYMVQSAAASASSLDSDSHSNSLSHATRVSPATQDLSLTSDMHPGSGSSLFPLRRRKTQSFSGQMNALYRNPSYIGMVVKAEQIVAQVGPESTTKPPLLWNAPLEWLTEIESQDQEAMAGKLKQVQWLLENYETAEGVSLPRSTLYNHYLRHCNVHKLDPVNAASFGKLIRSVFLGLRTRRLGTRGNSKYHYYGIRIKPGSSLNGLSEDGTPRHQGQQGSQKRFKFLAGQKNADQYDQGNNQSNHSSSQSPQGHEYDDVHNLSGDFINQRNPQMGQHLQYLGDGSAAIPDFPEIMLDCHAVLPGDCTLEDVDTLRSIYREHCEAFLDAINNLEFITIESLWREFWRSQDNNNGEECEEEKYLSKTKLYQLCSCKAVQDFMHSVDLLFYQNLVEVLIPDVLRPIPSSLTQAIRNFAKGLETWLTAAMTGCPPEMTQIKVSAVAALAQTLRRYTSLNHLAQAARAVLQNSAQITQMLVDLNRVDFHNVQEQASWVCECDDAVVQRLESDFKYTLQQQNSLEQWAVWLKGVVTRVLKPYEGKGKDCYTKAARQFLLKWSFYSSMVIRDLTLRSAASFGSFHLIRLLYDEYMFYLIEHEVAMQTGETPIAVMGEKFGSSSSAMSVEGLGLGYLIGNNQAPCNGDMMHKTEPSDHSPAKRHKIS